MTQVERLIRNLCEERRLGVVEGEREALKTLPESVVWSKLPPRIREAVRLYRFHEKKQAHMRQRVAGAGFQTHNMFIGKKLDLAGRDVRSAAIRKRYEARRVAIQKLRTDATIASLGKSAVAAQGILTQLQKDLAAI